MEHLDGIVKLAENEFAAIVQNGKFRSREEIDSVYKLMDIVKDRMKIECMEKELDEDDEYMRGSYRGSYDDGMSYARGRGRYAKRDAMGRYSRDGYRDSYDDGRMMRGDDARMMRGYSRDGKEEYKENLRRMMDDAPDENTRQSIKRMLDTM